MIVKRIQLDVHRIEREVDDACSKRGMKRCAYISPVYVRSNSISLGWSLLISDIAI